MIETNTKIQVKATIEQKDIAVNAKDAAKKYLAEVCTSHLENQKIIREQKERKWSLYISQLEN